jgi:cell fate (sporulation/competence/biofilm development) regulator YlbF (YheA/YmcA/DUF963 family)
MVLSEEIKNEAQALGESLRQDDFMHTYLEAVEELQCSPDARLLEEQLDATYNELNSRQVAGEQLSQEEIQAFYDLRHRVQTHPVISKRDTELRLIKPYLADVADEISSALGVEYVILAKSD